MGTRRALGIDISKWQGEVNFRLTKNAGASFVIIKASQNIFTDQEFKRSWRLSKKAGLVRGAYHFFDMREGAEDTKTQAEYFADVLKSDMGELLPALDFESPGVAGYPPLPDYEKSVDIVSTFLSHFHSQTGVFPMLYTNISGIERLSPMPSIISERDLWLAWYNTEYHNPPLKYFTDWRIWQYKITGCGKTFGAESTGLDMNAFNGTEEDLQKYVDKLGLANRKQRAI